MKKLLMILGVLCLSNALFAQANDVAWWEPAEPQPGDSITIFYDDVKGTLPDNGQLTAKLHWGINEDRPGNWKQPPEPIRPPGSTPWPDGKAIQSPMARNASNLWTLKIATLDTFRTIHFVTTNGSAWDNNKSANWNIFLGGGGPIGPDHKDTVNVALTVDLAQSLTSRGFSPGDTVKAELGYFNTAKELATVQLQRFGFTTLYMGQTEVITTIGDTLDYQYIKTKNGTDELEVYFNFDYDGSTTGEAQRRRVVVTGSSISVADTLASGTEQRRMPFFKNSSVIAQNVLVTLTCDVRPAIYQLLRSTAVLRDIQPAGTALDISDPDTVLKLGVAVNGPVTGSWSNDSGPDWGSHLMALPNKAMYDDGTHGDAVIGDSIFTAQFQFFKDSSDVIGQEFKFGIGGGDNEGGFGNNHVANIDDSQPTAIIQAQFGSIDPAFYDQWDFDKRAPSNKPSAVKNKPVPDGFALEQNYPNPFNPETRITYKIAKRGDVNLIVYNLLGEKVATLVDLNQNAGEHEIAWDGKNSQGFRVASGVYLYKLEAGEFTKVKKMLLLK